MNFFTGVDWIVLFAYFVGTMSIGFFFMRKSSSTEAYTAAKRSLPGWACGLSIFATYLSSVSFLGLPGKAYATNWNAFVFSLSLPIATFVAIRWFMPYYRSSGEVSAYAHLEKRFGSWARVYASSCYLLTQLARMGAVLYLMALPMSVLLGWDIRIVILVVGISVTVYSFVGGVMAVIWSDALQAIVLMGGALLCSVLMLFKMPEGPGEIFRVAMDADKFSLGSFGPSLVEPTFWVVLIYGIFINLQNFGIDQSFVQRYIASGSEKDARKTVLIGGLLYLPVSLIFFFIGTQLFAFYHAQPGDLVEVRQLVATQRVIQEGIASGTAEFGVRVSEIATTLTDKEIGDKVFPHFIGKYLPPGITGLLIAAIFAAAMSTLSTSLNSSATLMMSDWYKRFIRPDASERQTMRVLYGATIVWGLLGTGVAFLLINISSALDAWWVLSGIFGGGMLGLFLLGVISRKANNPISVTAAILGLLVIAWMTLSPMLKSPALEGLQSHFHSFLIPVFGTLTILLSGLILSRFRKA
ncbi:sodium:solute symporter [Tichowtungia aerotolerans]|uniref:Sodium/solute symporter n=1 Tax=Tichowtungia aerotolerans TaxID=2697043 RepID=A0A6P1M2U0_9BACT|nr:sodium:solute symporter [Tichowtungia aerotolerans]QHI68920.1 sodium/solute symporter [Tichowtungia aerotolerans]